MAAKGGKTALEVDPDVPPIGTSTKTSLEEQQEGGSARMSPQS